MDQKPAIRVSPKIREVRGARWLAPPEIEVNLVFEDGTEETRRRLIIGR